VKLITRLLSAEIKEWVELYHHSNTPSWRGAHLGEHREMDRDSQVVCRFFTFGNRIKDGDSLYALSQCVKN
jgi:hypothetical protein